MDCDAAQENAQMEESMYLLPKPKHLEEKEGSFALTYDRKIVISAQCGSECFLYAKMLRETILTWAGVELGILKGAPRPGDIVLTPDTDLEREGYRVNIDSRELTIAGGSAQGILYGVQTLRQIVSQCGPILPALGIDDAPQTAHRGFYHDVTRGRVPTLEALKKLADRMSYYKLNELQLYVEHSYLFRDLPELWRDETPLCAEEIMELDEYCAQRGIELVPSLASFGHLYLLLGTKSFSGLCELEDSDKKPFSFWDRMDHHTLNVSDPRSMELSKALIAEYMSLFRTDKFNLCADETFDLGKGKSRALAEEKGTEQIYISYVKELCEFLIENHKQPMFWGDIICGFPEYLAKLPKGTVCLNWGYAPDQREDETRKLAQVDAVQYVCPGVAGWNQFMNCIESSYKNIYRMCRYGEKYNAVGVLNTDWGDYGHINHPDLSIPGMIYGAAFSWNIEKIEFEEINRMISKLEYHDHSGRLVSVLAQAEGKDILDWGTAVRYVESIYRGYPEEERNAVFLKRDMSRAEEANKQLDEICHGLRLCMKHMDSSCRRHMQSFEVAIAGIQVWNEVGAAVAGKLQGKGCGSLCTKAAENLERWFMDYKTLWRTVSREGDLARIARIVLWYADFLRDRKISV